MRLQQCGKCPWRKDVDPRDIPDGYCEDLHRGLASTIAEPGTLDLGTLRLMACHETAAGDEQPCVGWLAHQLGEGNNIALRMWFARECREGRGGALRLVGEQHSCFEDTLPAEEP